MMGPLRKVRGLAPRAPGTPARLPAGSQGLAILVVMNPPARMEFQDR
jgi:hypothetical protein